MRKSIKTQEKTQYSGQKLKKSALLGFQGAGKASKQKAWVKVVIIKAMAKNE